jgi:hypothetical protein
MSKVSDSQSENSGRYKSFQEFSEHFYTSNQSEKVEDQKPGSPFGVELSREVLRRSVWIREER